MTRRNKIVQIEDASPELTAKFLQHVAKHVLAGQYSKPFKFGGGWCVEEYRSGCVIRSHIMPSRAVALQYRQEKIGGVSWTDDEIADYCAERGLQVIGS